MSALDPDLVLMPGEPVPARTSTDRTPVRRPASTPARYAIQDSPLWMGEHSLSGRLVTHPAEVAIIAARVARLPRRWWTWCRLGGDAR